MLWPARQAPCSLPQASLAAAVGFGLVSTIGFPLYLTLIPEGEVGGYTALYFSVRAISSAIALPAAGWAITVTGTFRSLFVLGGAVTLLAVIPLIRVPSLEGATKLRILPPITIPRPSWLLSWTGAVVLLGAVTMFLGLMLGATGAGGDEALFRAINGLGQGPELIVEIFDPHTRNYVILTAIAVAAAALTRPRRIPHVLLFVTLSWILAAGIQRGIHVFWNRPRPEEVLGTDALLLDGRSWAAHCLVPAAGTW